MDTKRFSQPILLTLCIAIISIAVPIVWDLHKTKDSIEFQHLSTTLLIEKSPSVDKLKILYDNNEIESLSKIRFALVNTGKRPIVQKDLISPPTLTFSKEVNLLEFKVDRLNPQNLEFQPELNRLYRTVKLSFPLFNPSDVIEFSVLLSGSVTDYKAEARIAGIKEIKVIDRAKELEKQPRQISLAIYFIGIVTFILGILVVLFIFEFTKGTNILLRLLSPESDLLKYQTKSDYVEFIDRNLSHLATEANLKLRRLLDKQETETLSITIQKEINDKIIEAVKEDKTTSLSVIIVFSILMASGLWYILSHVL